MSASQMSKDSLSKKKTEVTTTSSCSATVSVPAWSQIAAVKSTGCLFFWPPRSTSPIYNVPGLFFELSDDTRRLDDKASWLRKAPSKTECLFDVFTFVSSFSYAARLMHEQTRVYECQFFHSFYINLHCVLNFATV